MNTTLDTAVATLEFYNLGDALLSEVYLTRMGCSDFGVLRARYISTGILVMAFITISCLTLGLMVWILGLSQRTSMSFLVTYLLIMAIPCVPAILLIPLTVAHRRKLRAEARARGANPASIERAYIWWVTQITLVGLVAVLAVVSVWLLWVLARDKPLTSDEVSGVALQPYDSMVQIVLSWDQVLVGPSRWPWFAFACFLSILPFYLFLNLFVKLVYDRIPEAVGGGKPRRGQLVFSSESCEAVRQLGVPIAKSKQVSDPLKILFDGANSYVLQLPNDEVIQINKGIVEGLRILTERPSGEAPHEGIEENRPKFTESTARGDQKDDGESANGPT